MSHRVLYLIQTFDGLAQIQRLVSTVLASDPCGHIIVSHNSDRFEIGVDAFDDPSRVSVMNMPRGNRVDFYQVDGFLRALAHAERHSINFDWMVNITGQCYPTKPLGTLGDTLARSGVDAHLLHGEVFGEQMHLWPPQEARARYQYRYHWRLTLHELPKPAHIASSLVRELVNRTQPWVRMDTAYALQIGVRHSRPFLPDGWRLYGGFYFMALGHRAAARLLEFSRQHLAEMRHFRLMNLPSEVFAHTVLANQPDISLGQDIPVYVEYNIDKRGRPRVLTTADLDHVCGLPHHFARKFDARADPDVFDELDKRVFDLSGVSTPDSAWAYQAQAA